MNPQRERLVIRVEALSEPEHVRDIIRRVRLAPPAAEVILELAPSAQCGFLPLSVVAREAARSGAKMSLRGVSQQQLRILQYLGVPLGSDDGADAGST